jgi:protein gp37
VPYLGFPWTQSGIDEYRPNVFQSTAAVMGSNSSRCFYVSDTACLALNRRLLFVAQASAGTIEHFCARMLKGRTGYRMALQTKIEWTEATWNPVRGCVKISPGCKHCYAETFAERFRDVPGHPYEHGFDPRLVPTKLVEPFAWSTPRTVFVNSMSDLFQDAVPDEYIAAVATVMLHANWHTYQILTKRAGRLEQSLKRLHEVASAPHIWWGVSVEDKKHGIPRIENLQRSPAVVRFLSIEPLLQDLGKLNLEGIHWVIVGGESGPGARRMDPDWVIRIKEQCESQRALFFFKQWGGVRKATTGRELGGRTFDAMPSRSPHPVPPRATRERLVQQFARFTSAWDDTPLVQLTRRFDVA